MSTTGLQTISEYGRVVPCSEKDECLNQLRCCECRLAFNGGTRNLWRPRDKKLKHPTLEEEKKSAALAKKQAKKQAFQNRNIKKITLLDRARRAEKQTEKNFIRSTVNSGRRFQDGDHVAVQDITLDTKLQTTAANPIIKVSEVEKVRDDARRSGRRFGALVIRNKLNRGFVVFAEEDAYRLLVGLKGLLNANDRTDRSSEAGDQTEATRLPPGPGDKS